MIVKPYKKFFTEAPRKTTVSKKPGNPKKPVKALSMDQKLKLASAYFISEYDKTGKMPITFPDKISMSQNIVLSGIGRVDKTQFLNYFNNANDKLIVDFWLGVYKKVIDGHKKNPDQYSIYYLQNKKETGHPIAKKIIEDFFEEQEKAEIAKKAAEQAEIERRQEKVVVPVILPLLKKIVSAILKRVVYGAFGKIFYDESEKVAVITDGKSMLVSKSMYIPQNAGLIVEPKTGKIISEEKFPDWKHVIPRDFTDTVNTVVPKIPANTQKSRLGVKQVLFNTDTKQFQFEWSEDYDSMRNEYINPGILFDEKYIQAIEKQKVVMKYNAKYNTGYARPPILFVLSDKSKYVVSTMTRK